MHYILERTLYFLHILYYLKQDGIPVHGLIVGSVHPKNKEYFSRLKYNIRNLKLTNDISILLNRKDLREIMTVSDLVVSCSRMPDAFDRPSLMALSLGVPVIAYSHGVLKEHLKALYPYGVIEANKKSSMRLKISEFYRLKEKPKPLEIQNSQYNKLIRRYSLYMKNYCKMDFKIRQKSLFSNITYSDFERKSNRTDS